MERNKKQKVTFESKIMAYNRRSRSLNIKDVERYFHSKLYIEIYHLKKN